jgi:hypothetical protein
MECAIEDTKSQVFIVELTYRQLYWAYINAERTKEANVYNYL